ncbi:MAG: glycosyltransferase family 39 protein [Bacteroidales bacterium]|nr:glycosyltransferase family 39 protein [Bacteroidales bacterium]
MTVNKKIPLTNQYSILLILLILLLIVMSSEKMGNDEGRWSYIGRVWCENSTPPYVGAIENKPPGIFELHAISYILFGVNYFFVRVLGVVAILFSSLIIYLIGKKLHTHLAGIFSMVIFGFTMTWHQLNGAYTAQTETFMVLFSTLSFYFIIKGAGSRKWKHWVLLSGFSMGLAIAFKQIAVTTTLALIIFFIVYAASNLTNKNKLLGLILLGSGIIISTIFSLIPLLVSGVSLVDYIDGAWLILLKPGSSASIMLYVQNFFRIWFGSRMVSFYPFLCLLFLQSGLVKNKYFIGLLIWMLFDFIGVNASGYYYGHQIKQFIPSVSIIIGVLLNNLLMNRISEKSVRSRYATIILISSIILLFPYGYLLNNTHRTGYSDTNREIGRWLEENTKEADYVYIAGTGGNPILSYSGRVSSSKYFNTTFVTSAVERELLLFDLEEKPPLYYLSPKSSTGIGEKVEGYIMNNYSLLHTKSGYEIFKRNSLSSFSTKSF